MRRVLVLLEERWPKGGPWVVKCIHRDGLLAIGSCPIEVQSAVAARILSSRGSFLWVQPWLVE